MRTRPRRRLPSALLVILAVALACRLSAEAPRPLRIAATVDGSTRHQRIDGFGVNVTPAQWRGGALRPALDRLVDDLGVSVVRLDCYGKADWLDPAKAGPDKRWPAAYLEQVYRSQVFTECWDTFRHFSSRGVDVHLNASGRVPASWTTADGQTLTDFEAYAEMVASLARWARDREGLPFTVFAPFNETNIGFPEGPKVRREDIAPAVHAVLRHLDAAGLADVRLVVMCDSDQGPVERYAELFADASLRGRIAAFSGHMYEDDQGRATRRFVEAIRASANPTAAWMTEYGDLDQSGLIEWQFAWRSTRRLLTMLEDGFTAAFAWDAFDNLHEHDATWAEYGLLRTDRATWTYTPRKRYFAARQVYRFVRPGWSRIEVSRPRGDDSDVYFRWSDPNRLVRLVAFASADGRDVTIVGQNQIEQDTPVEITLTGFDPAAMAKSFTCVRTTRGADAVSAGTMQAAGGILRVTVPEGSIFTLTTLR